MMKMTGNASTIDDSTRAWWLMGAAVVVFALFWETRALVSVQIVEVPAARVLHMAETGTIRWARISGGTLIVAAARPQDATATSRLREAIGLPADGRLFLVRPATAADLIALRAALERHAVGVRGSSRLERDPHQRRAGHRQRQPQNMSLRLAESIVFRRGEGLNSGRSR